MYFHNLYQNVEKRRLSFQKTPNWIKFSVLITVLISALVSYRTIKSYFHPPEAVFVLGGHELREKFAADLAKEHPNLEVWVSSGSPQEYAKRIFAFRGINSDRIHLDYQAQDTVTNFTTLVDKFKAQGIESVYLVTSDNHMTRARIIGEIIFGSRGITIQPLSVPSGLPPEPLEKCLRDSARALVWLATGYTGATLADFTQSLDLDSKQH